MAHEGNSCGSELLGAAVDERKSLQVTEKSMYQLRRE